LLEFSAWVSAALRARQKILELLHRIPDPRRRPGVIPKNERPVLAEVTINAPCDFRIKVMHGNLEATAGKETKTLEKGHFYDVTPEFYVNDSRSPAILPGTSEYHRGHQHGTCALAAKSGRQPHFPNRSRFSELLVIAAIGVVTILALPEAVESPDRP
jgi:hypothetical protein